MICFIFLWTNLNLKNDKNNISSISRISLTDFLFFHFITTTKYILWDFESSKLLSVKQHKRRNCIITTSFVCPRCLTLPRWGIDMSCAACTNSPHSTLHRLWKPTTRDLGLFSQLSDMLPYISKLQILNCLVFVCFQHQKTN